MKTQNVKLILVLLIFTGGLVFQSCKSKRGDKENKIEDTLASKGFDNAYLESVYYRFPTPDEVFKFINSEDLKFNPSLLNQLSNVNSYIDSKSQTLALGVYIADLAYASLFEAYSQSIDYYKVIHDLSSKIRISSAYDLEVTQRIEKNLLNLDSLKSISIDSYSSMVEFLVLNNREKTLALIATGAYIECFYIAFHLAGDFTENNAMIAKIVDLKYAFDNLYAYLSIFSDDPTIKATAEHLAMLNVIFSKVEQKQIGKTTVTQKADGSIVLGGGTKLEMTPALYEELKTEIYRVRKQFVSPN